MNKIVAHPVILLIVTIGGVVQAAYYFLDAYALVPSLPISGRIISHASLIFLGLAIYGVSRIDSDNRAFKKILSELHDLNHRYRQALATTSIKILSMDGTDAVALNTTLQEAEINTLRNVVAIVSRIFSELTGRDVTTTIWLWDIHSRSCVEYLCCRENQAAERIVREISAYDFDENSIFRACKEHDGKCCHFLSLDIVKKPNDPNGYADQRPNHRERYQSIMTVPIRFKAGANEDTIGYLQIDTKSRNRLNSVEHLYLLSAFADQLYNFMSLMRRNYMFGQLPV